jgi:hypothetical protein
VSHVGASVGGYAAFLVSYLDTRRTILSIEPGEGAPEQLGPRVVIFAHFDRNGEIRAYTRAYIDALRSAGLDVVFVTNAAFLATPDHAWIHGRAARIVIRRNVGLDFGAWRDTLEVCGLPAANTSLLVLANDSVYGPLHSLKPVLDRIDFDEADVWAATDSWQHRFHLQSFFVVFGRRTLDQDVFKQFWRSVRNVRSKKWVVQRYEIGMSQWLMAAGLRCKAIWPYLAMIEAIRHTTIRQEAAVVPQVKPEQSDCAHRIDSLFAKADRRILRTASRRIPLNPMADLWRVLIAQGCPFIKRELLRDNPSQVPDVAGWSSVLANIEGFDRDIILRDLERTLRNIGP